MIDVGKTRSIFPTNWDKTWMKKISKRLEYLNYDIKVFGHWGSEQEEQNELEVEVRWGDGHTICFAIFAESRLGHL